MSSERDDGQATIAQFRQTLRTVRLLWGVTILGLLICVGAAIYAFAIQDRSAGGGVFFIGWLLLMIASIVHATIYRCPACGAGFGRYELSPRQCRRCGATLQP